MEYYKNKTGRHKTCLKTANRPTGEMNYSSYKNLELIRWRKEFAFLSLSLFREENVKTVIPGVCEDSVETEHDSSI